LEDFNSLEERQLQECTFSPAINYSTRSAGSIQRFDVWEEKRKASLLRKQYDKAGMELEGCTFKPEVTSQRPLPEDSTVFEYLYKVSPP
jgi:hypothetical protein